MFKICFLLLSVILTYALPPQSPYDSSFTRIPNPAYQAFVGSINDIPSKTKDQFGHYHTAFWLHSTYSLRDLQKNMEALKTYGNENNVTPISTIVLYNLPNRALRRGLFNEEICCSASCYLEYNRNETITDCIQGIVSYKNYIYQVFNILRQYPTIQKVIIIEPYSLSSFLRPSCPYTLPDNHKNVPSYRVVLEGYINSMIIALNKLSELNNVTIYLDGSNSGELADCDPKNSTCSDIHNKETEVFVNGYKALLESYNTKNISLSFYTDNNTLTDITIRLYTYINGISPSALDKIRGFVTNIGGYEPLTDNSLDKCSRTSEFSWIQLLDSTWKRMNNTSYSFGYVSDTSRNGGKGRDVASCGQWCNRVAKAGLPPTVVVNNTVGGISTNGAHVDALVWIRPIGTSDGCSSTNDKCNCPPSLMCGMDCDTNFQICGAPDENVYDEDLFYCLTMDTS